MSERDYKKENQEWLEGQLNSEENRHMSKEEFLELIERIREANEYSNNQEERINNLREEIRNTAAPVRLEELQEELRQREEDKEYFDSGLRDIKNDARAQHGFVIAGLLNDFNLNYKELLDQKQKLEKQKQQIALEVDREREERVAKLREEYERHLREINLNGTDTQKAIAQRRYDMIVEMTSSRESEIANIDDQIARVDEKISSLQQIYIRDTEEINNAVREVVEGIISRDRVETSEAPTEARTDNNEPITGNAVEPPTGRGYTRQEAPTGRGYTGQEVPTEVGSTGPEAPTEARTDNNEPITGNAVEAPTGRGPREPEVSPGRGASREEAPTGRGPREPVVPTEGDLEPKTGRDPAETDVQGREVEQPTGSRKRPEDDRVPSTAEKEPATSERKVPARRYEKSWLTILAENEDYERNGLPAIKNKHTLSERIKIIAPLIPALGVIGVATGGLGFLAGMGVIAGSSIAAAIAPNIVKRLTGQKKIEDQYYEQFKRFSEQNPEEFDIMIEGMTAGDETDITINRVVLNAIKRVLREKAKMADKDLTEELNWATQRQDELLAKLQSEGLTREEQLELQDATERIEMIKGGKDSAERGEASKAADQYKKIKRMSRAISPQVTGNFGNRLLNIFARRNFSSDKFLPAHMELGMAKDDVLNAETGSVEQAVAQQNERETVAKHSKVRLGISQGICQDRESAVTVTSDEPDRTVQTVAAGIIAAVSVAKIYKNLRDLYAANQEMAQTITDQNGKIAATQGDAMEVLSRTDANALTEQQATIGASEGRAAQFGEQELQERIADFPRAAQGHNPADWFRSLASSVRQRTPMAENFANKVGENGLIADTFGTNAEQQALTEAGLYERLANLLDKIWNMKPGVVRNVAIDKIWPMVTGLAAIAASRDRAGKDERKERKQYKEADDREEYEEAEEEQEL